MPPLVARARLPVGRRVPPARRETSEVSGLRAARAAQMLISPNEMGELFKVIALGRGMATPLLGFGRGDRLHTL